MRIFKKTRNLSEGFALIFAILASSLLVSIALAIWNIASREVVFSSFGRESQLAIFAADSGAECALYWDLNRSNAFATSTDSPALSPLTCAGITITPTVTNEDSRSAVNTFWLNDNSTICVAVIVLKNDPDGDGYSDTNVKSRGRNSCSSSDQTVVERGLEISY